MDSFDFDMAGLFCQRALDVDSNNLQALDMLGHICSELGDTQKAKEISFAPFDFSCCMNVPLLSHQNSGIVLYCIVYL